jgi:antitoxin VapB
LELKLERVRRLLDDKSLDGVLLQRSSSFSWMTCGADMHINTAASDGAASLLITKGNKYIFTNNIEAPRLGEEEGLKKQGWEFVTSPWYENGGSLKKTTQDMKLGTDGLFSAGLDISSDLAWLRAQLTENEVQRFRTLAALCAQSMQEAIEAVQPGMDEFQLAALLAQAAESRGVQAVVDLVGTDERISQYRHPIPTAKKLERYAMLILCGRKWGLICSITRLVHFGPLPAEIREKAHKVAEIDAAMIAATRPGETLQSVFMEAEQAYSRSGYPDEWKKHHQGGLAGYEPREITATPATDQPVEVNQVYAWNPSITGAKSEDTILVGGESNQVLTEIKDWPVLEIPVGRQVILRPAILEKD